MAGYSFFYKDARVLSENHNKYSVVKSIEIIKGVQHKTVKPTRTRTVEASLWLFIEQNTAQTDGK
jgi:hypothetical protein